MDCIKIQSKKIKAWSKELGFDACGIAPSHPLEIAKKRFEKSIRKGYHGNMQFLERDIERRFSPELLLSNCKSVIVVILNYNTTLQFLPKHSIARFALLNDYHIYIQQKLSTLLERIKQEIPTINAKTTVDTSSISEKNWAVEAGLGHIGKNGLLITAQGSFVHIGTILIDKECDHYDQPCKNNCGTCNKCIQNCPTQAIEEAHCINASKCISYQTIENKNPDYQLLKEQTWIYGCDICQEVCPYNQKIRNNETIISETSLFLQLNMEELENLSEEDFRHYFQRSGIKRRKYKIFKEIIKNRKHD